MNLTVIILAAGSGTRMKSRLPKVLHPVAGKPMVCHVIDEALSLNPDQIIVVIPKDGELVKESINDVRIDFVEQKKQLGTAHAVQQVYSKLKNPNGTILILYGDTPLIENASLKKAIDHHKKTAAAATIVTMMQENPYGYGRIIRSNGNIQKIVEERDANKNEKEIKEVNSGIYCIKSDVLFDKLKLVKDENEQKEYYLTDVIGMLVAEKALVEGFKLNSEQLLGINSRSELVKANHIMYQRIAAHWLDNGVAIIDPLNTYIDKDVKIGQDAVIYPQTFLRGQTRIARGCKIGPQTQITNSKIEEEAMVSFSVLEEAKVGVKSNIGPFSHLRPGTIVERESKVGAFSEIKNSKIGARSKVPHLSYIGDAKIEEDVNIGAGTITCNYDGKQKHKTVIKKGAFVGSDTMFVAPVTVGENAVTGAGSAITEDVPDGTLAIERSQQKNISNYTKRRKNKKNKQ